MGPLHSRQVLFKALAKGADKAIHISDKAFQNCDAFITAKIFANVIKNLEYDIILTGAEAADYHYPSQRQSASIHFKVKYTQSLSRDSDKTKKYLLGRYFPD